MTYTVYIISSSYANLRSDSSQQLIITDKEVRCMTRGEKTKGREPYGYDHVFYRLSWRSVLPTDSSSGL